MISETDRNIHSPLAYSMEVSSPARFHQLILRLSDGPKAKGLCMVRKNKQESPFIRASSNEIHKPVMAGEIADIAKKYLSGDTSKVYVDGTLGLGGHAGIILSELPNIFLIGLDRDKSSIDLASKNLAKLGLDKRYSLHNDSFDNFYEYFEGGGYQSFDFMLLDLGFSSFQIEDPYRGFSYRLDSKLDMRMNPNQKLSAYEVINEFSEHDLSMILKKFGDEKFHYRIAKAICDRRPISSTFELNEIIKYAIPAATRRTGGHPSQRTFQAIRIYVNSEFEQLYRGLIKGLETLDPMGLIVVLTYHSGEDRIVKNIFDAAIKGTCRCPETIPCSCGAPKLFGFPIPRKGLRPSEVELKENPRAKSAHLRVIQKLDFGSSSQEIGSAICRLIQENIPLEKYVLSLSSGFKRGTT